MIQSIRAEWGNERQYLVVGIIISVATHLAALGLWLLFGVLIANANRAVFDDLIQRRPPLSLQWLPAFLP